MTSKEALDKLVIACDNDLLYEQSGILYPNELIEIIEQDLDRLEKINEVWHKNEPMESVDINGNHLQEVYDFLHRTIKELEKYKSAIKIINDALELYVDFYEVGVENRSSFIDYEDSELLKEVLGYESCNI